MADKDRASNLAKPRTFPPIHPVGFALWPALALYGQNADKLLFSVAAFPLLIFAGIGILVPIAFRIITSTWAKASFMASVTIIALCDIWKPVAIDYLLSNMTLAPWIFYSLYGLLLLIALRFIYRWNADFRLSVAVLNIVALVMLTWPTMQIAQGILHRGAPRESVEPITLPENMAAVTDKPDVVLLILDEYSRADFLMELFEFDNREFIEALEHRGFVVARESESDYIDTRDSVPSMMNMDYVSELIEGNGNLKEMHGLTANNRVLRLFDAMGYETYSFRTGYAVTEPGSLVDHVLPKGMPMTEYAAALLQLTPANAVSEAVGFDYVYDTWRNNILHTLQNLHRPIVESGDDPVFVRAHILAPHKPYVFNADGGPRTPDFPFSLRVSKDDRSVIVEQTLGLNKHILRAVDEVLAAAKNPPIVIITGDHSTYPDLTLDRSTEILLALHLPAKEKEVQREQIDSLHLVNLFRLVFNTCFNADFPMLEDGPEKEEVEKQDDKATGQIGSC